MEILIAALLAIAITSLVFNYRLWKLLNHNNAINKDLVSVNDDQRLHLIDAMKRIEEMRQFSALLQEDYTKLQNEKYPIRSWLAPHMRERKWQLAQLKKLYPDYPNGPTFQYMNGLITLACKQAGIEVDKI